MHLNDLSPKRSVSILLVAFVCLVGCNKEEQTTAPTVASQPTDRVESGEVTASEPSFVKLDAEAIEALRPVVTKFCADCHVMPEPTSSPIAGWRAEVAQGFMLYETSGRNDLVVPDREKTLAFFESQANEAFDWQSEVFPACDLAFSTTDVRVPGNRPPAVSNVRWIDVGIHDSPALVYCDINTGGVIAKWPQEDGAPTKRLGTLLQPVHVEPCDLDADGRTDLVVADIGEFNADDSDLGRVVWLRRKADADSFEKIVLIDGLSRVADAQPGDFDGDGDTDVLVAAFGWRNSGETFLLKNDGPSKEHDDGRPVFSRHEVDPRHGPVNVTPIDLNNDGHLDFVALLSQEHERVEAFINDGTGKFRSEEIYVAPDPAYGSSGIQLVDMDGDKDIDVLYTNGDSFDRGAKPYHGIQWLENDGTFPYKRHSLCNMPGVLSARAVDLDGDQDMDVLAVALLGTALPNKQQASVLLLKQTANGKFSPMMIEADQQDHISVETGDFDGNGKVDFAVGNFIRKGQSKKPDLTVYWNK